MRLAIEQDVSTIPVVDEQERLLGGITTDELVLGGLILVGSQVTDIERPGALAVTALVALVLAMTMAVTLGATVPVGLHRWGPTRRCRPGCSSPRPTTASG